jgi:hypothetical protein
VRPARGDPEGDHRVAFGIRHVEQAVRGRAHVGRADAYRGRTQRAAVRGVRLDPPAPHPDDHDGRPVAGGGDAARLQGRGLDRDLLAGGPFGKRGALAGSGTSVRTGPRAAPDEVAVAETLDGPETPALVATLDDPHPAAAMTAKASTTCRDLGMRNIVGGPGTGTGSGEGDGKEAVIARYRSACRIRLSVTSPR